jgi:hypothetical protein
MKFQRKFIDYISGWMNPPKSSSIQTLQASLNIWIIIGKTCLLVSVTLIGFDNLLVNIFLPGYENYYSNFFKHRQIYIVYYYTISCIDMADSTDSTSQLAITIGSVTDSIGF